MNLRADAAVAWWRELQPDADRKRPGNRAALARLRRCAAVVEAMQEPTTIALFRQCGGAGPYDLPDAALASAVLAHVRQDDNQNPSIARRIGPDSTGAPETALLKPLRFRRLMDAATADERLIAFRRLVALTGGTVSVRDLATALLRWDERCRLRWVYDYWDAGRPMNAVADIKETPA